MTLQPPQAPIHPFTRSVHGIDFVDNYEWLREKESPATIAYLEEENAYTEQETAHLAELKDNIFQEIKTRTKQTDMSVPSRSGDFWYYGRIEEGMSYGLSCRIPVAEGHDAWVPPQIEPGVAIDGEQIIMDMDALAQGHEFFSVGAMSVTTSGRYLAYSVDTTGDERFNLKVKDLSTGELLEDTLTDIFYGATWVGEEYLFYQRVDDAWRANTVWRHKIGTSTSEDVLVFQEDDEHFNVGIGGCRSEKYLFIEVASKITSEVWVLEQDNPEGKFRCLAPRVTGVEYDVDHAIVADKDTWIITHNVGGANSEVGWIEVEKEFNLDKLNSLIPLRDDVRISGVDCYRDQIVVGYRRGALSRVAIMPLSEVGFTEFTELSFDEELYSIGVGGNPEWDAPVLRMSYTSFTTPAQLYDYWVATGTWTLLKEQEVLGGYRREDYVSSRLWVTARDGARIPVSLVHRADIELASTPTPTLLYGYGSYETSIDPSFSIARLSLLDRGMIYAIAHVRGGGEIGRSWYDSGKTRTKLNTFTDFIDVADHLINTGITSPDRLVAEGGSAGGLLMGAVANMAGDRFAAIEAVVPFVDPLTSMLMPELPLTVAEWDEWGDPLHEREIYEYMASYAPYENITAQNYPNILAVTSLNDTRVLYVEPAKWIARLRATATGGEFLLRTEMSAGHGGVSGRYDRWKQTAFEYAWLINQATGKIR
ncbi:S9 family peptidase [Corynebacterium kutscheri]|uniref:S9 family peptidase n=1 Tax=Corynebacterium kutscheri TaxID=35755 RepID=UPI0037BF9F67